jgi:hypothetical protein
MVKSDRFSLTGSQQAKAQIQEYKEVAKALFGYSLSKHKGSDKGQYQVRLLCSSPPLA